MSSLFSSSLSTSKNSLTDDSSSDARTEPSPFFINDAESLFTLSPVSRKKVLSFKSAECISRNKSKTSSICPILKPL